MNGLREKSAKWAITELLRIRGPLGFNDIFKVMQGGNWNYTIKSRNTLSDYLKELMKEGNVQNDIDTRKYAVTPKGEQMIARYEILDQINSCQTMDTLSTDWVSEFAYIFIDGTKDYSPNAMSIARERLNRHGITWMPYVDKVLESLGSKFETPHELWDTLFKGVKRIILIHTFEPQKIFEGLQREGMI